MKTRTMVQTRLRESVDHELEPGEDIVWADKPIPRFFTPASTGAFLFGIPWTAFAIFWMRGASGFKIPDFSEGGFSFFPLFGLPFVLIGVCMLLSPLWAYRKSLRSVYVITDRRAISFEGGWATTIRSFPPRKLQDVFRREKRDGTGDVIITQTSIRDSEGSQRTEDIGFMRVRDVKEVEALLKKLAAEAHSTQPRSD